jgi:hypothetical protein
VLCAWGVSLAANRLRAGAVALPLLANAPPATAAQLVFGNLADAPAKVCRNVGVC